MPFTHIFDIKSSNEWEYVLIHHAARLYTLILTIDKIGGDPALKQIGHLNLTFLFYSALHCLPPSILNRISALEPYLVFHALCFAAGGGDLDGWAPEASYLRLAAGDTAKRQAAKGG